MVHLLQLLLKHCGSCSDKFEFSYVQWMWCLVLGLGHSGARSGPELFLKDAINWSYFKLICQVIEPTTDQRFNIQEGKVTIWVWELLPLTRDKNHYCDNTLHFASYYLLHTFHCCTFGNTFDWFSEWVVIITYNKFVLCLLKEKKQIENKTKEKNRKSIGMDFFSLFNV